MYPSPISHIVHEQEQVATLDDPDERGEGVGEIDVSREKTVKAVHDDDLAAMLTSLGVYKDFCRGRLRCSECGDTITWHNLAAVYPAGGAVKCTCSRPECVTALMARMQGRRRR